MITVLSKQPHHSVLKEVVCRNCGCTLQYVPRDIKERIDVDYTGGRDIVNFIDCPECNTHVIVKTY